MEEKQVEQEETKTVNLTLTINECNCLLQVINTAAKSAGIEIPNITSYCLHFHKMLVDCSKVLEKS